MYESYYKAIHYDELCGKEEQEEEEVEEPFDENADSHGLTENDLLLETCDETDEVTKE